MIHEYKGKKKRNKKKHCKIPLTFPSTDARDFLAKRWKALLIDKGRRVRITMLTSPYDFWHFVNVMHTQRTQQKNGNLQDKEIQTEYSTALKKNANLQTIDVIYEFPNGIDVSNKMYNGDVVGDTELKGAYDVVLTKFGFIEAVPRLLLVRHGRC
jgi:hypothetical protein